MDKSERIFKRLFFIFLSMCFLALVAAGALKTYILRAREKKERSAAVGTVVPLIYIPGGKSYAISQELPCWIDRLPFSLVLIPGGLFFMFMGLRREI